MAANGPRKVLNEFIDKINTLLVSLKIAVSEKLETFNTNVVPKFHISDINKLSYTNSPEFDTLLRQCKEINFELNNSTIFFDELSKFTISSLLKQTDEISTEEIGLLIEETTRAVPLVQPLELTGFTNLISQVKNLKLAIEEKINKIRNLDFTQIIERIERISQIEPLRFKMHCCMSEIHHLGVTLEDGLDIDLPEVLTFSNLEFDNSSSEDINWDEDLDSTQKESQESAPPVIPFKNSFMG